ncbi:MAG: VOC family protein [Myxococcota bacterium]
MTFKEGTFSWVDLNAHDMDAALKWYGELFGWDMRLEDTGDGGGLPYALFLQDGKKVAGIGQMADAMKAHMPSMWNSYIAVESCEAIEAKAVELGAEVVVPTTQVSEQGWMACVKDPVGAVVGFWQANTHTGAEIYNVPNSFSWNELATRDIEAATRFYGDLLGWEFEDNVGPAPMRIIRNKGRENGHLLAMDDEWPDVPARWSVYFTVADCDAATQKAHERGGTIAVPVTDISVGRFSVVVDPQGASFYLFQNTLPQHD